MAGWGRCPVGRMPRVIAWGVVMALLASCGGGSKPGADAQNRPPTANAGPDQTVALGATVTLDGSGSTDPDGNALVYRWSFAARPAGSAATLSSATAVRPTFVVDQPGSYTVQLIVNDGQVDSAPDTVRIDTLNSAPVADAGPDQTVALGALVQLDGAASSDPDNDPISFSWTLEERPAGSAAALSNPVIANPAFTADRPGTYRVRLVVSDGRLESAADHVIISTANSAPVANAGPDQAVLVGAFVTLDGAGSFDADGDPLGFSWSLLSRPVGSTAALSGADTPSASFTADAEGLFVAQLIVNDGQADSAADTTSVEVSVPVPVNNPPVITSTPVTTGKVGQPYNYTVVATDADNDPISYSLGVAPAGMTIGGASGLISWLPDAPGNFGVTARAADGRGGLANQSFTITVEDADNGGNPGGELPPDPATVAGAIDPTVATTLFDSTAFLYSGANPIQTGVAPGTIEIQRVAVIRGRVITRGGAPLPGVTVSIKDHPEFGRTLSRADGRFDLAVNGGGWLTIDYQADGFLPAQRKVDAPWRDFVVADDVALIGLDPNLTRIDLANLGAIAAARGSVEVDRDGRRQATVLFKPGTSAEMILPDGSRQALTELGVRATEYTVGPNGPAAMPGELPANVAYTYAVELSVDEAIAAGATRVQFDRPVAFHVENFLGFPVGSIVPMGYYDRELAAWVPSENGRVIEILSIAGGVAAVDISGDGNANSEAELAALGIDAAERERLAALYTAGTTLWRVEIDHFTPWDCNWPFAPPDDAEPPTETLLPQDDEDQCIDETSGSIIECQNQALGQRIGVTGTPFSLDYRSSRQEGRTANRALRIPLTRGAVPPSLQQVVLEIEIAGRRFDEFFPAATNLNFDFVWDGLDAYGRRPFGPQPIKVSVGYVYPAQYQEPAQLAQSFARFSTGVGSVSSNQDRGSFILWQRNRLTLDPWDARGQGLGGWTLDAHHVYELNTRVLYRGDGRRSGGVEATHARVIRNFAGTGQFGSTGDGGDAIAAQIDSPVALETGPDGSVYIAEGSFPGARIRKVDPTGIITTIAGNGLGGATGDGDGGPATAASISNIGGLALGPDGSLYLTESSRHVIRRIDPNGIITTIAGTGVAGSATDPGDGDPATSARLNSPTDIVVAPDGTLFFSEYNVHRVRQIAPDGIISTVAGTGVRGFSGDGGPAAAARLDLPDGLALNRDGDLFIVDSFNQRVRRVGADGIITTVAGSGAQGFFGDGGPATGAALLFPSRVKVGPDQSLYIADNENQRIRRVWPDGTIYSIAGNGQAGFSGDNGPALDARFLFPFAIAVTPDDVVYIADLANNLVRAITSPYPGFADGVRIAAADSRSFYEFDGRGRHLRTVDSLTREELARFDYGSDGLLDAVHYGSGLVMTIERDAQRRPTALVAPFGQRTALSVDNTGYLVSLTNPANESYVMEYTADGLMTRKTDARNGQSTYVHNARGRLIEARDAVGNAQLFSRVELGDGYSVTRESPLGRSTVYRVSRELNGDRVQRVSYPSGSAATNFERTDGSLTMIHPEGTRTVLRQRPEPRFGMQAPLSEVRMTTPAGLSLLVDTQRSVELEDPRDPLILRTETTTMRINNRAWTSVYDAPTRRMTWTTPFGRTRETVTDAFGRPVSVRTPGLAEIRFSYDNNGLLSRMEVGDGANARVTTIGYGTDGWPERVTDPLGRTTTMSYAQVYRLLEQELVGGETVRLDYDVSGNMTGVQPPGRPEHRFAYTPLNQVAAYQPPPVAGATGAYQFAFDGDRQLDRAVQPSGGALDFSYDAAGRMTGLTHPGGSYAFTLDTADRLSAVTSPDGVITQFSYDGFLNTGSTWSGGVSGTVTRLYDDSFRVAAIAVNGQAIAYAYDVDDQVIQAGSMALALDPDNGLLRATQLGNVEDIRTHNEFAELVDYRAEFSGTALFEQGWDRDAIGRITREIVTLGGATTTIEYGYDTAGRLASVRRDGTLTESYAYDGNGNRLSGPDGNRSWTYDDQDRLLAQQGSDGTTSYLWDANGMLLERNGAGGVTRFSYDLLGVLRGVRLADGREVTYLSDGEHRRVARSVDGVVTHRWLYQDALNPVAELDGNNNVVSRFVYATRSNVPDFMIRAGVTYRILSDVRGSPRLVVDVASGNVAQRLDYDAFGRVINDTQPGFQPFGFAGGLYDPDTGLVRFGFRDYDAVAGRWLARDPIGFGGGELNLYAYVGNDPVNFIDPDGLKMKDLWDFDPPESLATVGTEVHGMWQSVKKWLGRVTKTWDIAKRIHRVNEAMQTNDRLGDKGAVVLKEGLGACRTLFSAKRDFSGYTGAMLDAASNTLDKAVTLFQERPDVIERTMNEHRIPAQPTPFAGYVPNEELTPQEEARLRADLEADLKSAWK
jgi:RHS repeat-associated protein